MSRARSLTVLALLLGFGASCSDTPTTPTSTGTGSFSFVQVFAGTLTPNTSQTFAFGISASLPVRITLGSLTDANEVPLSSSLTIAFGIPSGTGCGALQTVTTPAGLAAHLSALATPGTYCVSVTDSGQLSGPVLFGVRILQGEPSSAAGPGTVTYASSLLPGGFTSRSFVASASGTVTVFFDTIDQSGVATLGLGIGFPRSDGGGCQLTKSFSAARGSQFSVPVDAGTYCVKVFDQGTLTDRTGFSLRIQYP